MNDVRANRDAMYYMLRAALIEIRASKSLSAAQKFADVFHHLPLALLNCSTSEDYDDAFSNVLDRAKRCGLEQYVRDLRLLALNAVTKNQDQGNEVSSTYRTSRSSNGVGFTYPTTGSGSLVGCAPL